MTQHEVIVDDDPARIAAGLVATAIEETVAKGGRCRLVVSGGRTPVRFFEHLTRDHAVPWAQVHLFWADERFVPHDHADSNYGSAREHFVEPSGIPAENVHPWPIGEDPEQAAKQYARTLELYAGSPPEFDVTVLGLGADGHTASLFPHSPAVSKGGTTVATVQPGSGVHRLSLTLEALNTSRLVLFLVTGEEKRRALTALLAADHAGDHADVQAVVQEIPARGISARERLVIVTDVQI